MVKEDDSVRAVGEGDADGEGGARVSETEAADEGGGVGDAKLEDVDRIC